MCNKARTAHLLTRMLAIFIAGVAAGYWAQHWLAAIGVVAALYVLVPPMPKCPKCAECEEEQGL